MRTHPRSIEHNQRSIQVKDLPILMKPIPVKKPSIHQMETNPELINISREPRKVCLFEMMIRFYEANHEKESTYRESHVRSTLLP